MIKNWIAAGAAMTGLVCTGAAARPLLTIAGDTTGAAAQTLLTIDGDTTGAPTFNRATTEEEFGDFVALSGFGTAVPFVTIRFVVTAGGTVRLETVAPSAYDTTLFLYSDFDPSDPLANGIDADGDSGGKKTWLSLINTVLVPGEYVAVVTGFGNKSFGIFRLEIDGPVFLGTLEEVLAGDAGIMATEIAAMVTAAQTQGLRQIVRANSRARLAASGGSMVMSSNGLSTANFSVWAEIGGGRLNAEFGDDLEVSSFFGQAGVEVGLSDSFAVGMSVGGALTSAETSMAGLDGDALFVQPYLAFSADGLTAIASFVFTHTEYDDSTDNIDDGERFAGSLFLGYDVALDGQTMATPFGYVAGGVEQFDTSSGSEEADFLIGRVGLELSQSFDLLKTGTMHAFVSVAAEYVSTGEPELGAPALLAGYDDDRLGGRVEIGFDFTVAGTNTQIFAAANGAGLFTDAESFGGRVGLRIPF